jgi:transmembrane protein TMEM260 (protein O-mannosyltransferase)
MNPTVHVDPPGLVAVAWRAALRRRLESLDWRGIAAFGLPLALYVLTLAPTIYNLDSAELTTAAATGGITRATGYPLYLLLGYLWSFIPIGDVGYRMNLFSALNGALTIALADRILRRLRVAPWAAFGALGLLTCAPYFWALSLIAEVYTLQTALMAGLILLLLRWAEQPTPGRLALAGLVGGLSLGHHAMTVLLIPGCVWYVITVAPRRAFAPRTLLPTLGALLAGLCIYLYLPLRYASQPAFNYAGLYDAAGVFRPVDLETPSGLWWLITGRAFASVMLAYSGAPLWHETVQYGIYLGQAFFVVGVGPGLLGMIVLLRRDWRLGGMLLLMFAANAFFYIDYRVIDKQTMFLPTYVVWAIWLGVGYQWLLDLIRDAPGPARIVGTWLLRVAIVGATLLAMAWNWRLVDLSHDWSTRARSEASLRVARPNALVFGWWNTVPPIEYLQLVEGWRPDVQAINRFLIPYPDMRQLILREVSRRPVYVDSVPLDLLDSLEARPVGPLYQLCPQHRSSDSSRKEVVGCP